MVNVRFVLVFMFYLVLVNTASSQQISPDTVIPRKVHQRNNPLFDKLGLEKNYPDPFLTSDSTVIRYSAFNALHAEIIIYNTTGDKVRIYRNLVKGDGQLIVNGNALIPGVYVYALVINGRLVKKHEMFLLSNK